MSRTNRQKIDLELSRIRVEINQKLKRYKKNGRYEKAHAYWDGFIQGTVVAQMKVYDIFDNKIPAPDEKDGER